MNDIQFLAIQYERYVMFDISTTFRVTKYNNIK